MVVLRFLLLFAVAFAAGAGCFSPLQPACAFSCASDGRCPAGYSCTAGGLCHRDGDPQTCDSPSESDASQDTGTDDGGAD